MFILYYSGHGDKETGGWKTSLDYPSLEIEESLITMDEIFELIAGAEFTGDVEITTDSCYAGKLCYRAQELWNDTNVEKTMSNLKVAASCNSNKKCAWGNYRKMKNESQMFGQTKEEAEKIQKKYTDIYGLTEFNSKEDP